MIPERENDLRPPGEDKGLWRETLEAGARLLQSAAPLRGFDIYVVGFHCARQRPEEQMEAHHYCKQVNADFLQCAIFDGNTEGANLIGVEYIVSGRLFESLPEGEKASWHPHNYEVLGGSLTAPGLPVMAEQALMRLLINSYGKTWHLWHTGRHDGQGRPADPLPLGDATLMWSFNRHGEADASLVQSRAAAMGVDEAQKERERAHLAALAGPQQGVDLLRGAFPNTDGRPGGVRDIRDTE